MKVLSVKGLDNMVGSREEKQELVKYVLILVLVAVVVIVILVLLGQNGGDDGPVIGNIFSNIVPALQGN